MKACVSSAASCAWLWCEEAIKLLAAIASAFDPRIKSLADNEFVPTNTMAKSLAPPSTLPNRTVKDAGVGAGASTAEAGAPAEPHRENSLGHERTTRKETPMTGEMGRDEKEGKRDPGRQKERPKVEPSTWQSDAVIDPIPSKPDDVPGPP